MIDPQAGHPALVHQLEDQAVGGGEHLGILDVDAHQVGDVEEAAVIDLFASHLPER